MSGSLRWILGACLVLSVLLLVFEGSGQLGAMGKPTERRGTQKAKRSTRANLLSANGDALNTFRAPEFPNTCRLLSLGTSGIQIS